MAYSDNTADLVGQGFGLAPRPQGSNSSQFIPDAVTLGLGGQVPKREDKLPFELQAVKDGLTPTNLAPQYDANGFMAAVQQRDYGANPWDNLYKQEMSTANSDSAFATSAMPGIQQNVGNLQGQYNDYASVSGAPGGSYPTYQNSFGLGSQSAFSPAQPSPGFGGSQGGQGAAPSGSSSSGGNPWSLTGESNARG